jgi:hypothetical protein
MCEHHMHMMHSMAGMEQSESDAPACAHCTASHHMPMQSPGPGHAPHHHELGCLSDCCCTAIHSYGDGRLAALPVVPVALVAETPPPVTDVRPRLSTDVRILPPLGPPSFAV